MRTTWAIAKKELAVYFTTPLAWVAFTAMAFITAAIFVDLLVQFQAIQADVHARATGWAAMPPEYVPFRNLTDGVVVNLWNGVMVVTLFVAPFLSMRLFAEERRQKTLELLLTTPTRALEVVLGKYLGALGIIGCTLGVAALFPVLLAVVTHGSAGASLDWGTVWLGFAGLLLFGATTMAIGLFVSSLTDSQMVAALVSFAIALVWTLVGVLVSSSEGPVHEVLAALSFDLELRPLLKGVLDLRPVVFFSSVIALFLALTHRSLEAQRWT